MFVLGVDPGLFICGYALVSYENSQYLISESGVIKTDKKEKKEKRLQIIYNKINNLIRKFNPGCITMEKVFFYKNKKNALIISQVQAIIMLSAATHDIPVFEYTPLQIKKALTGVGFAKKEQIKFMVKNLLALKDDIRIDDVADACACSICHINTYRYK